MILLEVDDIQETKVKNISDYLAPLTYPGRTIMVGNLSDGTQVIAYALMGRSKNSQNRVLVFEDGKVSTDLFEYDENAETEWTLYDAVVPVKESIVVANGNHSVDIADGIENGEEIENTLIRLTYEGDACATPRIAAVLDTETGKYSLILISKDGEETSRIMWTYQPMNGYGRIIHTYTGEGGTECFTGNPVTVALPDRNLLESIWGSLDKDNRVSLFVVQGDDGQIINRNEETRRNRIFDRPLERKMWRLLGPETCNRKLMNQQRAIQARLRRVPVAR